MGCSCRVVREIRRRGASVKGPAASLAQSSTSSERATIGDGCRGDKASGKRVQMRSVSPSEPSSPPHPPRPCLRLWKACLLRKRLAFAESLRHDDARFVRFVFKLLRLVRVIEKVSQKPRRAAPHYERLLYVFLSRRYATDV